MNCVVMKFGGTSVGSTDRITAVAKRVAAHIKETGERVILVVSAMSGETDRLLNLSKAVSGVPPADREYHQILAAGEQVTSALTAMALCREGLLSESLLAHQVPIRTEERCGLHLIDDIPPTNLLELLKHDVIPVVAGFQGVDEDGDLKTLGRGGSDTTAVALAAALKCRCIIYTDVDGVYSALPSLVKNAKKLSALGYEEMLELAAAGAKVLQARSVSLAKKYKVPLIVASSFEETPGTEIVEEYPGMEDAIVSGVTSKGDQSRLLLRKLPDEPGVAASLFAAIAEAGVVVDDIVQTGCRDGFGELSFTVPGGEGMRCFDILSKLKDESYPSLSIELEKDLTKISVVGEGMRTHSGVAAEIFEVLGKEGINIEMISTSEIKVSVMVNPKHAELAVRALHERFVEQKS